MVGDLAGVYAWRPLGSSSLPWLDHLRFGDFDGDGVTDILAVEGGGWAISRGGTRPWEPLQPGRQEPVAALLIGDLNADGVDDLVRYTSAVNGLSGTWEVSWGGRTAWAPLATFTWDAAAVRTRARPARDVRTVVGRFDAGAAAGLLAIDPADRGHLRSDGHTSYEPRRGYLYTQRRGRFVGHSVYAY